MKTKIWVLTSEAEDDVCVCRSEEEALETFEVAMLVAWHEHAPPSEKDNFPDGDPWRAHAIMAGAVQGWPKWRVIPVEVEVPIPQAFQDLLTLAQGVEDFRLDHDYRMNAVLRACEALVGGAEPSPAPFDPIPILVKGLREIAEWAPDEEPDPENYDDTESAYENGTDVAAWERAIEARKTLTKAGFAMEGGSNG